jgi:hypothetical protein
MSKLKFKRVSPVDIENRKIKDLTVRDLTILFTAYDSTNSLKGLDYNKLFLIWFKSRGIDYEIKSEYDIDKEKLEQDGYKIICR